MPGQSPDGQLIHLVAIIDANPRGGEKIPMAPAEARRYNERSAAERIFAYLENYGAYTFRVRGAAKVMCHLTCPP